MSQLEEVAQHPDEGELEAARSHYFDLYERAPVAYLTVSPDGLIQEANLQAATLLAGPRAELAGQPIIRFILDLDREIFYLYRKQFLKTSEPYGCELRMVASSGMPFLAQLTVGAARAGTVCGGPPLSHIVLVDITERKRIERERLLLGLEAQQNQKQEIIGLLAGGVAHDFNNLLATMVGNADLGRLAVAEQRDPRPFFQVIEDAAMRAADLTRQMLAYAGGGKYWVTEVDLNLTVRETAQILSASFPPALTLHLDLAEALPYVRGDSAQIVQVLMNLVANASEAFADGAPGRVTLRTRAERIEEGPMEPGPWVLRPGPGPYGSLEVLDTGSGMTAEVLVKAFEPFFTTRFAGRGLGLAAAAGILRAHGGGLKARSDPGQGSSFTLFLPLAQKARTDPEFEAEPAWRGEGRLLLVDPEPAVRNTAQRMAEHLGFEVLEGQDGPEAVQRFGLHHGALVMVLLGLPLPGAGREALRAMRRIDSTVPLVLSGPDEVETVDLAREGLAGYLRQPYRLAELQGLLQRAMARRPRGLEPAPRSHQD